MDNMDILLKRMCLYCRKAFTVVVEDDHVFVRIARTKFRSLPPTKSGREICRVPANPYDLANF